MSCAESGVVNAQAGWLAWEDGIKGLQWQGEAWGWRRSEGGCTDDGAGICESEWAEDGGEDGVSVGILSGADYLQDVLRALPGGVWSEWVRHPCAAVSGVPGRSGRGGAAGGGARLVRLGPGPARTARSFAWSGESLCWRGGVRVGKKAGWSLRLRLLGCPG